VIFGADATKACGGPLTSEILPKVLAALWPDAPTALRLTLADLFGPGRPPLGARDKAG
jgi:hypothetical protein